MGKIKIWNINRQFKSNSSKLHQNILYFNPVPAKVTTNFVAPVWAASERPSAADPNLGKICFNRIGTVLEKKAINRRHEIKSGASFKQKGAKYRKKDRFLSRLVNRHKQAILNDDQYFDAVVELLGDYDI